MDTLLESILRLGVTMQICYLHKKTGFSMHAEYFLHLSVSNKSILLAGLGPPLLWLW